MRDELEPAVLVQVSFLAEWLRGPDRLDPGSPMELGRELASPVRGHVSSLRSQKGCRVPRKADWHELMAIFGRVESSMRCEPGQRAYDEN